MKISKIKLGIVALASIATFFGFSVVAKADQKPVKQYNHSVTTQFEIGSNKGSDTDITSTKETIDLKFQKDKWRFNIKGSHTDYSGKLEGKKARGSSNSLRIDVGKKVNNGLYLSPYTEIKDDIDPLREFSKDDVSCLSLGVSGECLLKKPITVVGDIRGSALKKGDVDYLTNLGLMYYFNDDWVSVRGVHWKESLRDVDTTMVYGLFHHEFNEKVSTTIHCGIGKESGARKEKVYDAGGKLAYKIKERLSIGIKYNHYEAKSKDDRIGIGFTWRF